ncbi:MAG: arginase family protein, partial [Nitrososphaeraceae archaeon]
YPLSILEEVQPLFVSPELGDVGVPFADFPMKLSLTESNVIVYGVPLDLTTSFGKGTGEGPNSIRLTSAKQIETYLFEENTDLTDKVKLYDLGDLKMPQLDSNCSLSSIISSIGSNITLTADHIKASRKIPILLGGEHTISYYQLKALADTKPLILHFDAHRDLKPEYGGMVMCHTTPFYHLINDGHIRSHDLVQIGIRQCDRQENQFALNKGVVTYDAWTIHDNIDKLLLYINEVTCNRVIYISFDIDVYDLSYVPCTGCPEPYGLDPFQVTKIIKSISSSAMLIGIDMVEVAARNNDYREGTLAVQTLYRMLVNLQKAYS